MSFNQSAIIVSLLYSPSTGNRTHISSRALKGRMKPETVGKSAHITNNKYALADAYQVGIIYQREKHYATKS
jgi:hypothetical protein